MDKNSTIGLILISVLMFVWYYFFAVKNVVPPPPSATDNTAQQAPAFTPSETPSLSPTESITNDSIRAVMQKGRYDDFAPLTSGTSRKIVVKTDELTLYFDTHGGRIERAELKNHTTFKDQPLPILLDTLGNELSVLFGYKGLSISTKDLYFEPSVQSDLVVSGSESKELRMRAALDSVRYLEQVYTFKGNSFDIGYAVTFAGLQNDLKNDSYELYWNNIIPKTEQDITSMRQKSTLIFSQFKEVEKLKISDDPQQKDITTNVDWVAYKSQFFSAILHAKEPFRSARVKMLTPPDEQVNRIMETDFFVEARRAPVSTKEFSLYLGPNEYSTLRSYKTNYQDIMDLGWWIVGKINIGTVYIFKWLEKAVGNYGLIIIILAFLIKLALFPLTFKNYISMAKLRVINSTPEMKALDEKHKDDPQKLQMAKMPIYKEMGVSMFGGCLPMVLQYPFLIAMFFFFPQSVELRHQSFLWAKDLSTYDSIASLPFKIPFYGDHVSLFCILMTISIYVYTYFTQKSQPTANNPQMKYITYLMPVIFLFFLNNYSAGLSLYYFMANLISISQTGIIRLFIDDKKLLDQMHTFQRNQKDKKGNGKTTGQPKGRLESWLENQKKSQQEVMKQRQQTMKGNSRGARRGK